MNRLNRYELTANLIENVSSIKNVLGNSSDVVVRELEIGRHTLNKAALIFIDGIVDGNQIEEHILEPLLKFTQLEECQTDATECLKKIKNHVIDVKNISEVTEFSALMDAVLNGKTVFLLEGAPICLAADTIKYKERSLESAKTQRTLKGPNVGFTEVKNTNLALIRRIVKNPFLRIESKVLGTDTKTDVSILYLEDKVDQQVLQELHFRLDNIKLASLLEAGYIERELSKEANAIFPLIYSTDRPEVVSAAILEGRIAVIVDGSAYVMVLPCIFWEFFIAPDDYFLSSPVIYVRRIARLFSYLLALYAPAFYIAFSLFHPGLLPPTILIGLLSQRELVPLPVFVEVLAFYLILQAISEAATRVTSSIVLTISIFGAILIGQSAVEAQFVTPATLIIISGSFILANVVPNPSLSFIAKSVTLIMIIISSVLGLYGIFLVTLVFILRLCSLQSFGVPYLSPIAPFNPKDQKDVLISAPISEIAGENSVHKMRREE